MRCLKVVLLALFTAVLIPGLVQAQTGSTGTVTGTGFDKSGAVVPNAKVELKDTSTNAVLATATNDVGQFVFTSVKPGTYQLKVTAPGFRQAVMNDLKVTVGKETLINVTLETGAVSEVVEVHATTGTELQTLNSSVGNELDRHTLENLPALNRDATSLLLLQPMATPGFNSPGSPVATGEGDNTGGQVAGARSDQNTFLVDGGDATDSTAGGGQYSGTNFTATPRAVIPTPVESLQEFRVVTNNPEASFARSAGGEVQMVTRSGSNAFHGAAYDYLQNNHLNANSWTRNSIGQKNPVLRDNRFGGRVGGPIWKDKTFFFAHYEGRRFFLNQDTSRLVPTDTMKAGILRFRDASGAVVSYNLNPGNGPLAANCGPAQDQACDPRALGLNPVIKRIWALEPTGNDPSLGDGLNTTGFTAPAPTPINEEFGVIRLDHKISQKWQFRTSYRYSKTDLSSNVQVDIGGLLQGNVRGQPKPTAQRPLAPRYLVAGLTGQITPHLTSDFTFDWLRHWWQWATVAPFPQDTGTAAALSIGGEGIRVGMQPINVDTQNARSRLWNGKDYTFIENLSWIKGSHLFSFGGRAGTQRFFHQRDDKVVGGLTSAVYTVGRLSAGSNVTIPATNRPPTCGGGITTNCLSSREVQNWRNFYASVLGIVDRGSQLLTRGPDFSPNRPGTPLLQHTVVNSYQLYISDTWKLKPSFTVSVGLNWGVQLPPYEQTGESTIMVDHNTGKPTIGSEYLAARRALALQGKIFNPQFDFVPIRQTGRKYPYDPDWRNFAPRVAVAWNPSATEGFFGKIFGDRKTVIRTGYARTYDRINGVGIVMIPALGIGFGNSVRCQGPTGSGAAVACSGASNPTNAFRIGTDGTSIPIPSLAKLTPPLIPGKNRIPAGNSPYEGLDFRIDPNRKVGYSHSVDLTIQRELPGNMLLEVGYVARYAKRLYQGYFLNQVPYMFTLGGQSFASAFSGVANALRNDQPVPTQPFYETLFGGKGSAYCRDKIGVPITCTAAVVNKEGGNFPEANVYDFWADISSFLPGGAGGADTNQVQDNYWIGSDGHSNYNAGFVTLRKRTSRGLAFDINYTYSHAFDQLGQNQESLNEASDAFNLDRDYGSAQFDRRHALNALVTYDLPFGQGHKWSSGKGWDKVVGGWNVAAVYVIASGLPLDVIDGNSCEEYGQGPTFGNCSGYIPISTRFYKASINDGNAGSGGIGTSSKFKVNGFADPASVFNNFRTPDILLDSHAGRAFIRGLTRWNVDIGISKTTKITERISTRFDIQMANAFNHPLLQSTGLTDVRVDLSNPRGFGVIGAQYNQPRFIQFGLRFDF